MRSIFNRTAMAATVALGLQPAFAQEAVQRLPVSGEFAASCKGPQNTIFEQKICSGELLAVAVWPVAVADLKMDDLGKEQRERYHMIVSARRHDSAACRRTETREWQIKEGDRDLPAAAGTAVMLKTFFANQSQCYLDSVTGDEALPEHYVAAAHETSELLKKAARLIPVPR